MAFGDLRGTLGGGTNSITNPMNATGSVVISVGDLIVAVIGQQTNNTSTACGDNLHGASTYTAQNAGSGTTITGRMWYKVVTVAGTLTTVGFTTTASANDCAVAAAVFRGPFQSTPIDANPANGADTTTPFAAPATGTLAQATELIVAWQCQASTATQTATAPFTKAIQQAQSANANTSIFYDAVESTSTVTPGWTGTSATAVQGTASFKADTSEPTSTYDERSTDLTPSGPDTSQSFKWSYFNPFPVPLTIVVEEPAPFFQTDWPNPIITPRGDIGWAQSLLPLFEPVQPVDTTTQLRAPHFSNPRQAEFFTTDHYFNVNLRSLPTERPFAQLDWPVPYGPQRPDFLCTWSYNLNLIGQDQLPIGDQSNMVPIAPEYSIQLRTWTRGPRPEEPPVLPFNQRDWPNPRTHQPLLQTWYWNYNLNLIGQDKLPSGKIIYDLPPQPHYPISLRTVTLGPQVQATPFNQEDWPLPRGYQPLLQTWSWSYNLNLIGQDALPVGDRHYDLPPQPQYPTSLRTLTGGLPPPPPVPFNQEDWPLPRAQQQPALGWTWSYNLNLIGQDQLPPGKVLLGIQVLQPQTAQTWISNAIRAAVQAPFNQFDWPLAQQQQQPYGWVQPLSALLKSIRPPISQSDWPILRSHAQFNRGFTASYNLNLIGKDRLPFRQQDWPLQPDLFKASARRGIDTWGKGININLFPPPPPPTLPVGKYFYDRPPAWTTATLGYRDYGFLSGCNLNIGIPIWVSPIPPVPPPTPPDPSTTQGAPGLEWQPYDRMREPGPIGWR